MKIFGVPEWDGQWLYSQQRPGKAPARGGGAMNLTKIFEIEAFTNASRMAGSAPDRTGIRALETKLNGSPAIFRRIGSK